MAIVDALVPEFDHEMAVTRKVLERVNDAQFGWQPHEKSMTLGRLATHVAEIPQWSRTILTEPEFNMVDGEYKPTTASTTAEVLQLFDGQVKTIRELLVARTDGELMPPAAARRASAARRGCSKVGRWSTGTSDSMLKAIRCVQRHAPRPAERR